MNSAHYMVNVRLLQTLFYWAHFVYSHSPHKLRRLIDMARTQEQSGIVQSTGHIIIAEAFAGTGKTSTLCGFAEEHPSARILYLAFNKPIQMEAEKRFPKNVTCKTTHSVAYSAIGHQYAHKLAAFLRTTDVLEALGLKNNFSMAQRVIETISSFIVSDKDSIAEVMDPTIPNRQIICSLAESLWGMMKDTENTRIGMLHDGYLKLFQLSRPILKDASGREYDIILFDEAQDANPVTSAIVACQRARRVYVGDRHQQIYLFRGAENAMEGLRGDRHYLTQSFRFGPEIAHVANTILRKKGERRPLIGKGASGCVDRIDHKTPHTLICRTNGSVFYESVYATGKIHFVGGIDGYKFNMIEDVHNLKFGGPIRDSYIRSFKTYKNLEEFVITTDDPEMKLVTKIIDDMGEKIPKLISEVHQRATKDPKSAKLIITTAHKSKGLEWEQVRLADDFITFEKYDKFFKKDEVTDKERAEINSEMNLLYVAATRATAQLQPNEDLLTHI